MLRTPYNYPNKIQQIKETLLQHNDEELPSLLKEILTKIPNDLEIQHEIAKAINENNLLSMQDACWCHNTCHEHS